VNQNASPREIVNHQLIAYNARDIDAYCALYASDAVISTLNDGKVHARGLNAIRAYYANRFSNSPHLHCQIKFRFELGHFVVAYELVTGIEEGVFELIAIFEVRDSLIQTLRFIRP
jgi:hypothetical protein